MDDRRRLGFGIGDKAYMLTSSQTATGLSTNQTPVTRALHHAGDALLAVLETRRVDEQGSIYSWPMCIVLTVDGTDHVNRMEWHDIEDFDVALARLDELGASSDPLNPRVENAVTRPSRGATTPDARSGPLDNAAVRAITRVSHVQGTWDDAAHLFAEDAVLDDRRRIVGMPPIRGKRDLLTSQRASAEFGLGHPRTSSTLAIRGERLSLHRSAARTAEDFEVVYLAVVEVNDDHQVSRDRRRGRRSARCSTR